jgi:hypothetical protein
MNCGIRGFWRERALGQIALPGIQRRPLGGLAQAIVLDAPKTLSLQTLELKPFEAADLAVEVGSSGISAGIERLLWDGCMPPSPRAGLPAGAGLPGGGHRGARRQDAAPQAQRGHRHGLRPGDAVTTRKAWRTVADPLRETVPSRAC